MLAGVDENRRPRWGGRVQRRTGTYTPGSRSGSILIHTPAPSARSCSRASSNGGGQFWSPYLLVRPFLRQWNGVAVCNVETGRQELERPLEMGAVDALVTKSPHVALHLFVPVFGFPRGVIHDRRLLRTRKQNCFPLMAGVSTFTRRSCHRCCRSLALPPPPPQLRVAACRHLMDQGPLLLVLPLLSASQPMHATCIALPAALPPLGASGMASGAQLVCYCGRWQRLLQQLCRCLHLPFCQVAAAPQ